MPRMWVGDSEISRIQELAVRSRWLLVAEIGERYVACIAGAPLRCSLDPKLGREPQTTRGWPAGGGRWLSVAGGCAIQL